MLRIITLIVSFQFIYLTSVCAQAENSNHCSFILNQAETCQFSIVGIDYQIFTDGLLKWKSLDMKDSEVRLVLPEGFYIESAEFELYQNGIFFNFGITDDDAGGAIIAKFDPISAKFVWSTEVNAFNTSPLLISNDSIYVAGIGTEIRSIIVEDSTGTILSK